MTAEPPRAGRLGSPLTAALAVLPCRDLEHACAFYARLRLEAVETTPDYRILVGGGVELHLRAADADMPAAAQNPCGVYLRTQAVDALAAAFTADELIHPPLAMAWGMYEFALSDPDGALVRVGWPERLRAEASTTLETPSAALGN